MGPEFLLSLFEDSLKGICSRINRLFEGLALLFHHKIIPWNIDLYLSDLVFLATGIPHFQEYFSIYDPIVEKV